MNSKLKSNKVFYRILVWALSLTLFLTFTPLSGFAGEGGGGVSAFTLSASIDPVNGDFGMQTVGYGAQAPKDFTVTNNGDEDLTGMLVGLVGDDPPLTESDFEITTSPLPGGILEGASEIVSVKAKDGLPVGIYTDTLKIVFDGGYELMAPLSFRVIEVGDKVVTVTWNAGTAAAFEDGSIVSPWKKDYVVGDLWGPLPLPERAGYDFAGWFKTNKYKAGQKINYGETNPVGLTGNVTYYAKWTASKYTVTFDPQKEGAVFTRWFTKVTETFKTVTFGKKYGALLKPSAPGWTFSSWNTKADGSGTTVKKSTVFRATEDVTLYAVWKAKTFKITYNGNGGKFNNLKNKPGTQKINIKTDVATYDGYFPDVLPVRAGYEFNGWNTKKNGTGEWVGAGAPFETYKKHTLYAQWAGYHYDVVFDSNGGDPAILFDPYSMQFNTVWNANMDLPVAVPSAEQKDKGLVFKGWSLKKKAGSAVVDGKKWSSSPPSGSSVTLYAQYANSVTIKYNANGGKVKSASKSLSTGATTYGTLKTPTRTGYTFEGWYDSEDAGFQNGIFQNKITSAGTALMLDPDNPGNTTSPKTVAQSIYAQTLKANWTPKEYKLTFYPNGGTLSGSNTLTGKRDEVYEEIAGWPDDPTRADYTFIGWYTKASGGKLIKHGTKKVTANAKLYAHWTKTAKKVVFNGNNGKWGKATKQTVKVNYGDTYADVYASLASDPTRKNYALTGWYAKKSGGKPISDDALVSFTAASRTIYAQWTKDPKTVKFNRNSGTFGAASATSIPNYKVPWGDAYGSGPSGLLPVPNPPFHLPNPLYFAGWYTTKSDTAKKKGLQINNYTELTFKGASQTLYARWTQNPTEGIREAGAFGVSATALGIPGIQGYYYVGTGADYTTYLYANMDGAAEFLRVELPPGWFLKDTADGINIIDNGDGTINVKKTVDKVDLIRIDGTDEYSIDIVPVAYYIVEFANGVPGKINVSDNTDSGVDFTTDGRCIGNIDKLGVKILSGFVEFDIDDQDVLDSYDPLTELYDVESKAYTITVKALAPGLSGPYGVTLDAAWDGNNITVDVSGALLYSDNSFDGPALDDFATILDGDKPDASVLGGAFTYVSINLKEILLAMGYDSVYIVQTNPALAVYGSELLDKGSYIKKKAYPDVAGFDDDFNILLVTGGKAKLEIFESATSSAPVLTVTIDASSLIVYGEGIVPAEFTAPEGLNVAPGALATLSAQSLGVSGVVAYEDNVFAEASVLADFEDSLDIAGGEGRPLGNGFTLLSITNFSDLLLGAGIVDGDPITIVQTNDALKLAAFEADGRIEDGVKTATYTFNAATFDPYTVPLIPGPYTATVEVYAGSSVSDPLAFTLTIDSDFILAIQPIDGAEGTGPAGLTVTLTSGDGTKEQALEVSGVVEYGDNDVAELDEFEWITGDPLGDPAFTYISIGNFAKMLADAGVIDGGKIFIVQENGALDVAYPGSFTSGIKSAVYTPFTTDDFARYVILLLDGESDVTITVYAGEDDSGDMLLKLSISSNIGIVTTSPIDDAEGTGPAGLTVSLTSGGGTKEQALEVSGLVEYGDNDVAELDEFEWITGDPLGDPAFTYISIGNFAKMLTDAGVIDGDKIFIVQENGALDVAYPGSFPIGIKSAVYTPFTEDDFARYVILLLDGESDVTITVYAGEDDSGDILLKLSISSNIEIATTSPPGDIGDLSGLYDAIDAAKDAGVPADIQLTEDFYDDVNDVRAAIVLDGDGGDNTTPITIIGLPGETLGVGIQVANDNYTLKDIEFDVTTDEVNVPKRTWGGSNYYVGIFVAKDDGAGGLTAAKGVTIKDCNINVTGGPTGFTAGVYVYGRDAEVTIDGNDIYALGSGARSVQALGMDVYSPDITITNNILTAEYGTARPSGDGPMDAPASAIYIGYVFADTVSIGDISGNTLSYGTGSDKMQYSFYFNAFPDSTDTPDEYGVPAMLASEFATPSTTWALDAPGGDIQRELLDALLANISGNGFGFVGQAADTGSGLYYEVEQYQITAGAITYISYWGDQISGSPPAYVVTPPTWKDTEAVSGTTLSGSPLSNFNGYFGQYN